MPEDLKKCPFCGAPAEYDSQRWIASTARSGYTGHSVYCSSLDCNGENGTHDTMEEAVEAWNRRAV